LRGKTSASTGDIPHLSPNDPVSPRFDPAVRAGTPPEGYLDNHFVVGPPLTSFLPTSPPRIEERAKGNKGTSRLPPAPKPYPSHDRQGMVWKPSAPREQSSRPSGFPAQQGYYQPSLPMKIHHTNGAVPMVLSPPRTSLPSTTGGSNSNGGGYLPPPHHPGRGGAAGGGRPRSQSIPTNVNEVNNNNNSNTNGPATSRRTYSSNNTNGNKLTVYRGEPNALPFDQPPYPPQYAHAIALPKGGPYPYPFASAQQFNRQGVYWQGYPQGNVNVPNNNHNNNPNFAGKGASRSGGNQRYPPSASRGALNAQSSSAAGGNQALSAKALREKLLDHQEATVPPPPQKRKVKGTWQVKNKTLPVPPEPKDEKAAATEVQGDQPASAITTSPEQEGKETPSPTGIPSFYFFCGLPLFISCLRYFL